MTDRWQPTRAGLCNVWRYADEVLTFHRGRLLLRGANGSGKSMALELLLPFLLDANARPDRLTSGTKARGGLYDRLMAGTGTGGQVGFLWVEFQAGSDVFTIGVRLRTSSSTREVDKTWFAAPVAVGRDVRLLDEQRVPLSVQALKATFGEEHVFENGEDYRRVVRQTLFPGFDERQYDAVITTLLSLRREKISQDLSPAKLSEVLTESLPPLDEFRLAEVAEGFERLDRRQAGIDRLQLDRDEMRKLARRHRAYVRLVLASVANQVTSAESVRDSVTKDERQVSAQLAECRDELSQVEAERAAHHGRSGELTAEVDALRSREAYREGDRIEALRREAVRASTQAEETGRTAAALSASASDAAAAFDDASSAEVKAGGNERRSGAEVAAAAGEADAASMFQEAVSSSPDDAERLLVTWEAARETAIREVTGALQAHDRHVEERTRREVAVDEERAALDDAVLVRDAAVAAVNEARAAYVDDVHSWVGGVSEVGDAEALHAALPAPPDDPEAVAGIVRRVASQVREARVVARGATQGEIASLDERAASLAAERDELVGGRVTPPVAPAWRSEHGRAARDGAPLWQLVDVEPGAAPDDLDAVEAALVASGLLDAWVSPDGLVSLPGGEADAGITLLATGDRRSGGGGLRDLLRPADVVDRPVPFDVVDRLLRTIAWVDDATAGGSPSPAIGGDGSFRLDPLVGRGSIGPAAHIGEAAREEERRRRIAVIGADLAEIEHLRQGRVREIEDIDRRLALLEAEVDALPSGGALDRAEQDRVIAGSRVEDGERRVAAAVVERRAAEERARAAQRQLMQVASTHRLPTEEAGLAEYAKRVRRVRDTGTAWVRRRREAVAAATAASRARAYADDARRLAERAERSLEAVKEQARALASQVRALEETVGAEYREIAERIGAAESELVGIDERVEGLRRREVDLAGKVGGLETKAEAIESRRHAAEAQREQAHEMFRAAVSDGLVVDAGVEVAVDAGLSGVTAVLDAARDVRGALGDVAPDEASISKEQQRLADALHVAKQGSTVELSFEQATGGWWVLRGVANGLRRSLPNLVASLEAELTAAGDELRADEKQLFEDTLSGSVRQAVADRLRRATTLIDGINQALAKVRTDAAGVGVRLRWEIDPEQPQAVRSARKLLLRDAADWTDAERSAMFDFFRARLEEAKAKLDGQADWTSRLREALDYRHWHHFTLEIAHRDWDGLQPATAHRLARLSTGERSIALHLPMLASVAAHYDGSGSDDTRRGCPRLILLDELFAGVDTVNRAQLFGMFVTWDLDAVFTSDHEWCAYATLDGIAIHHLHAADADEPVTTARFVWDGRSRTPAPVELVPVPEPV